MRNIEEIAAEEGLRVWETRNRGFKALFLLAGVGFEVWGWYLFSREQLGKGAFVILVALSLFALAWGILGVLKGSFLSFAFGMAAALSGLFLYSYSRLPSFYWGNDPSFWLSVHAGAVTEPFWSPLSYLLGQGLFFLLPRLQFSFLPELSAILLSMALFFTLQVYFSELRNKTFLNFFTAFLICLALEVCAPFWNAGTLGSGLPATLGFLIFLFQVLFLKREERPWRCLYFLLGLLWSVHPLWGVLGLLNHLRSMDFEGKKLNKNLLPLFIGITPYFWVELRAGKFFLSWGGTAPYRELVEQWKTLWLQHLTQDWSPQIALKALGWTAIFLGFLVMLGLLLSAFGWKTGEKIQFSVVEFWIWLLSGAGGILFYSVSSELSGPTILWFLAGLGAVLLKLLEKGSEKRNANFFSGDRLVWLGTGGLVLAISLVLLPGQNYWRSQFYFPQQHALNLLQSLGEKSILVCQDPFEAAACVETRLMEPSSVNSVILWQQYLNQKWFVTQVTAEKPGILFSNILGSSDGILQSLVRDNIADWDIHWDLSALPVGWKGPAASPTVLTQEFSKPLGGSPEPELFQYRYDLTAMPEAGPPSAGMTKVYYSRYVTGFDELGKYLMGLGKYSDSIRAFDRALKLDPSFQEPQTYLAQIYSQKNILEAAQLEFEKNISVQPEKIAELMKEIEDAQKTMNESKTVSLLDQMIQLNAELANAQYQLSKIYDQEGRAQESKALLESSVNINPQQLEAQLTLGRLMKRMGNRIKAQEAFHAALVIDQQNKEAQVEYWKLLNNR